jgi:hypothetical protein
MTMLIIVSDVDAGCPLPICNILCFIMRGWVLCVVLVGLALAVNGDCLHCSTTTMCES